MYLYSSSDTTLLKIPFCWKGGGSYTIDTVDIKRHWVEEVTKYEKNLNSNDLIFNDLPCMLNYISIYTNTKMNLDIKHLIK